MQWQYKLVVLRHHVGSAADREAMEAELNQLGADGWELTAIRHQPDDRETAYVGLGYFVAIFKRPAT